MGDSYVGELRMFAGNYAPAGWNFCDGSLLNISDNDLLFNLIGTTYGGDGQNTFQVPDLRGRVPLHQGTGSSGTTYTMGQQGGTENVTLVTQQLPVHNHPLQASSAAGDSATPANGYSLASLGPASVTNANAYIAYDGTTQVTLAGQSIGGNGGSQPHSNVQPTLTVNFIISLYGIYPSQT